MSTLRRDPRHATGAEESTVSDTEADGMEKNHLRGLDYLAFEQR